jgi:hypothetical protein
VTDVIGMSAREIKYARIDAPSKRKPAIIGVTECSSPR